MSADRIKETERPRFEQWVSASPHGRVLFRFPASHHWCGQYVDIEVQLAWEAWNEALKGKSWIDRIVETEQRLALARDYANGGPSYVSPQTMACVLTELARLKSQLADALKVTTEATIEHVKGKQR